MRGVVAIKRSAIAQFSRASHRCEKLRVAVAGEIPRRVRSVARRRFGVGLMQRIARVKNTRDFSANSTHDDDARTLIVRALIVG